MLLALPSAKVVLGIANWRPCGIVDLLRPWGEAMRAAGGYVGGPVDLWPNRN